MKISFSKLPKYPWWGTGTPAYENNLAMKLGSIPKQDVVEKEHAACFSILEKYTDIESFSFPEELDTNGLNKHDFIFTRDAFISNQRGKIVISNFAEKERQEEAECMENFLERDSFSLYRLPENAYAEGGEFYYIAKDDILFAGISRNNRLGISETARLLSIKKVFIVESDSFHLDTVFTVLLDKNGHLKGIIVCSSLIKNKEKLLRFAKDHHVELIDILPIDTVGFDGKGKISVNCLPLPGVLIGGDIFETKGVEERIARMGIRHIITPVSQFKLSGGGVHCLVNELWY